MLKQVVLLLSFFIVSFAAIGQNKYTISGYVKDAKTGESILNTNITLVGNSRGISTNAYGFYSLTLAQGSYTLIASHLGYSPSVIDINLTQDTVLPISLTPAVQLSEEVVVTATKRENNVKTAQLGKISLPIEQIKKIPAFLGEVDILKTLQLLPGIRNAGEGSAGLYVRGGGADQNLILLDGAVVYNSGHLFGFFSIFNSDAIKDVTLIKGGMPAQYGSRLSSVIDVTMKDGNNKEMQVEGGIGLIASRISIQGPIKKNKSSFILSGRRTYIDALTKPFVKKGSQFDGSGYYFYDLNAKLNYIFSNKDRVFVSGYFGKDVFDFKNNRQGLNVNIPWGNATGTVRWNHVFNKKLFVNTTALSNRYNFTFNGKQDAFQVQLASGIRDYSLQQDYDYYVSPKHKVKFGGQFTYHRFQPSIVSGKQDSIVFNPKNAQIKYGLETALYIQDDWEVSNKFMVNFGLRYSDFGTVGPYKIYEEDDNGNRTDSTVFGKGKLVKNYGGAEPRVSMRYSLDDATSLKWSVTRNLQYIHLVSNAGTTLPTDIWVPSTLRVQPQKSWMYAAGLFKNFESKTWETSVEVYYKSMQNQIEYREGYTPNSLKDTEEDFVFGKGWSYGTELFVNKVKGKFTGWIGYTLSYTWRKFADLNQGRKYPAKYDRRHDLSVVGVYELSPKWKLSAAFVYATGNAATLPERFYITEGVVSQQYSDINQYRLPAYHRLDLSATLTPRNSAKKKLKSEWVFGVYNTYSRQNPYFIYFDQSGSALNGTLQVQAKQVSIFPIIPSVTWNFKF